MRPMPKPVVPVLLFLALLCAGLTPAVAHPPVDLPDIGILFADSFRFTCAPSS